MGSIPIGTAKFRYCAQDSIFYLFSNTFTKVRKLGIKNSHRFTYLQTHMSYIDS